MSIIPHKTAALIGFAKKGGKILCGDWAVKSALKKNTVLLLIVASDMPAKRITHWERWCADKNIPFLILGIMEEYLKILGAKARNVMAITDKQMASAILKSFENN